VVYDPNYRPRLTDARAARSALERVAPHAALMTPSCPDDTRALLGTDDRLSPPRACVTSAPPRSL
jgi:2-dehydro-3-deoxygluconokinase